MDFTAPYRVITPTLEGPVLRALADVDTSLTRTQIVKVIEKASEAGVRKALSRLVDQGIVIEERTGSRYTYRANRAHLLWPNIEGIFNARTLLRERVLELTSEWDPMPVSVELFGSVAQGTSDEASDIDILIIRPELDFSEEDDWDRQVGELHDNIVRWTGNSCDIVVMNSAELQESGRRDEPILRSPMSNLAGVRLEKLKNDLQARQTQGPASVIQQAIQKSVLQYQMPRLANALTDMSGIQKMIKEFAATLQTANMSALGVKPESLVALRNMPQVDPAVTRQVAAAARAIEAGGKD